MRKQAFYTVPRMPSHDLPPLGCPFSATSPRCSSAVRSPSSSIKLSHILCWSAVRSLSRRCTISLPTCCTLHQPLLPFLQAVSTGVRIPGKVFHAATVTPWPRGTRATPNLPVRVTSLPSPGNGDTGLDPPASATNHGPDIALIKERVLAPILLKRTGNFPLSTRS